MWKLILPIYVIVVTAENNFHPLSEEFIEMINTRNLSWKAGRNFDSQISMEYFKQLMCVLPGTKEKRLQVLKRQKLRNYLPSNFDAREKWPECNSIGEIRDQGSCGSCWAFGAVEAMTDRVCIHSKGKVNVRLSAENLVACCDECGFGCNGGHPERAWEYWVSDGIVSGGSYNSNKGCQPYSIAPCNHFGHGTLPSCTQSKPTPKCRNKCKDNYLMSYEDDKIFGERSYQLEMEEDAIKMDIFMNGPVEAAFEVFEDLLSYKSGVYRYSEGWSLGGHAIKILGWGEEDGVPYWLISNSWNSEWGDKGFFKMLRGENECGIEARVTAGLPRNL